MDNNNSDKIVYHYVVRNLNMFDKVKEGWFKNVYISKLFKLSKRFYDNFKVAIFDVSNPLVSQIENFASNKDNIELIQTDSMLTKEENLKIFLFNADIIIKYDYNNFTPKYIEDMLSAFVEWNSFQDALKMAVEYQKVQPINSIEDMRKVVSACKDYIQNGASVRLDDDIGVDFFDPLAHVQPPQSELINSGFRTINEWVSENPSGGFERGTTTVLLSLPNVGKSIFLSNIAYNMFMYGHNVLLISLEMATYKILRRIGSNAMNLNMDKYANMASNPSRISSELKKLKENHNSELVPPGVLRLKRFSSATVDDIISFWKKLEAILGIEFGAIVLDYFTELHNKYGLTSDDMYSYHKQNMNDLYNAGVDYNKAIITAHQVKVNNNTKGASSMSLSSMSESTGISFRPDYIFGINQTPQMKFNNTYVMNNIKSRDARYKDFSTTFEIDYSKMRLIGKGDNLPPDNSLF